MQIIWIRKTNLYKNKEIFIILIKRQNDLTIIW